MRNGFDHRCCAAWGPRIRRGSAGVLAILAVLVPAAIRATPVAAATSLEGADVNVLAADRPGTAEDPGLAALRRGEVDLVATYRTVAEDPCLILKRDVEDGDGCEASSVAMLVRSRKLDLWLMYFATADQSASARAFQDAGFRMRWRASRGVHAVALDPAAPRAVEAAVAAWYAHRPPGSDGSLMRKVVRTEDPLGGRRAAARRIAR
jgi:hypothetical protein